MRPLLVAALAASLALSGLAAWWPDSGAADDGLLPAARAPRATAVAALNPPPLPARSATPAPAAATPASAGTADIAPAALPTRAADWPAPGAAALAAWQGATLLPLGAAAPAVAAASALPQQAPSPVFPYQWIGQLDDGTAPQALLASAQRSVAVRRGAVLDGRWRLDRAPGEPWKATHLPSGAVVAVRGSPAAEP